MEMNDRASSYVISKGCCATLYVHADLEGKNFKVCGNEREKGEMGEWEDKISSIEVHCGGHEEKKEEHSDIKYHGCYVDQGKRDLPHKLSNNGNPEECVRLAREKGF
jgi:hypothetical protein